MYTAQRTVEALGADLSVGELLDRLDSTSDPREIERIAGSLGAARDQRAIRPLLRHLGDDQVLSDLDAEDSVCRALVAFGVMRSGSNGRFCLQPRQSLPNHVVDAVHDLAGVIPWYYFGTRRI